MTGQSKDRAERNEQIEEAGEASGNAPASGFGPSTKELLHLLRMMEAKASV